VAVENPKDVCAISARPYGQRAVFKFANYVGATPIAGRFTPGTFTNQIQKAFLEPRLLIVTDPRQDVQAIREASFVNIPVIALCNTDSPLRYVDLAIPCNNKSIHSIGLVWYLLAREVLRLRGTIKRDSAWEVMPDLFFYREPEEAEKTEEGAATAETKDAPAEGGAAWDATAAPAAEEWSATAAAAAKPEESSWDATAGSSWAP